MRPDALAELEVYTLRCRLGTVTTGAVIEQIAPVGPASVPELNVTSSVDLALAVWPFPLEPTSLQTLTEVNYKPVEGLISEPEQRFFNPGKNMQLLVVGAGSDLWTQHLLVRDSLRSGEEAQAAVLEQPDVTTDFLREAERWWISFHGFSPLEAVAKEFHGFTHPWFFSSGWALDLFLGRVTREHHDVDVIIPRTAIQAAREHLNARGWRFVLPPDGRLEP